MLNKNPILNEPVKIFNETFDEFNEAVKKAK